MALLVDHHCLPAALGEQPRRGRARRPAAEDEYVAGFFHLSGLPDFPEPLVQAAILPRARRPARRLARFSLGTFYIGIAAGAEFHAHRRALQLEHVPQESL